MKEKTRYNFLIFACTFLWVMMLGSKNVYTAELVEITGIFGVNKAQASLAMTYYFITYSTAQVFLFFFMDHINIKLFMLISTFLSGIVTVIVAFATGMYQLWWILALNGILQAGVWGMCLAVLKKYLPADLLPTANTVLNVGMAVAGIVSYGSSALFVSFGRWDLPFIVLGAILSLSGIIFFISVHICDKNGDGVKPDGLLVKADNSAENALFALDTSLKKTAFYVITFLFSLIIHFAFYGTMNWMPNLLTENYHVENSVGILISVLAPLATVIGPIISIRHCEKNKNFIKVSLIYLSVATALALLMVFVFDLNIILATVTVIAFLVVMQGIITIVFSVVSLKMGAYVNTGAHASLMNAAGGYSAGFAPTIVGSIIDNAGWQISYLTIFATCAIATFALSVILLLLNKSFKRNV